MSFTKKFFCALLFLLILPSIAPAANAPVRVGVSAFDSKVREISNREAAIITDLFTFELVQSRNLFVMERASLDRIGEELRFNMSGLVDPMMAAEIGKIAGLQYMLLGSITQVNQRASSGGFSLIRMGSNEMSATVDMRVVDVQTGQVMMAFRAEGSSRNESSGLSIGGFTQIEHEFGGLEARAIADAVSRLSAEVRRELGGEYNHVVSVTSSGFAIDATASSVGTLYLVYMDGRTILGINNEVIGREKIPLAILKVTQVGSGHSIAEVVPQGGSAKNVQRGDKIELISAARSREMAGKLPANRPAESTTTIEDLFGAVASAPTTAPAPEPAVLPTPDATAADPAALPTQDTATVPAPLPAPAPAPGGAARVIEGIDPNTSTDSRVIQTYPLSPGEANIIGIRHRSAYSLYEARRYQEALEIFSEIVESYSGNYLSAYWAGMTCLRLRDHNQEAARWFDRALSINPNYEPAKTEREKLDF